MNKMTKASIATASGVILLMGGAASLAYWNDAADLGANGVTITAGTLTVAPTGTPEWTLSFDDDLSDTTDPVVTESGLASLATVEVVPGNILTYTQDFSVVAEGNDLYFTVAPSAGALTGDLAAALSSDVLVSDVEVTGSSVSAHPTAAGVFQTDDNAGTAATITVEWTITWPFDSDPTVDNPFKGDAAILPADGALTVTQVSAP